MKIFGRVIIGVSVGIVIFLAVLILARNLIISTGASSVIRSITGVEMKVGKLDVGLFNGEVGIKDLTLLNPPAYPERMMMDMPELKVKYDIGSIMKGVVHLPELKVDLKEFVVVRNSKGEVNVNSLQALQPKGGGGTPPKIKIDTMELSIGKVIYKQYPPSGDPKVSEFKINLRERYENISDPNALVGLIVAKALRNTSIEGVSGIVNNAEKLLGSSAKALLGTAKRVGDKASEAVDASMRELTNTFDNFMK